MPWPFSRKKKETGTAERPSGPQAPRAEGADTALVDEILAWLKTHAPEATTRKQNDPPIIELGDPPRAPQREPGPVPAGAVLRIKRGKLSWVDLHDPALRETINQLVQYLDKQQKWSFNGVISTKYRDE